MGGACFPSCQGVQLEEGQSLILAANRKPQLVAFVPNDATKTYEYMVLSKVAEGERLPQFIQYYNMLICDAVPNEADFRYEEGGRSRLEYGVPGRIRTRDPLLRRQLLYPPELQGRNELMNEP